MAFGQKKKRTKKKSTLRRDIGQVANGIAKELVLIGLHGVQELTGADMHYKPQKGKQPWEKKWGER